MITTAAPIERRMRLLLLVEDDPGDAELIREMVEADPLEAYELVHTTRVSEAEQALLEVKADALLVDLNLPDSTGEATVERLAKKSGGLPIVVLTGMKDEEAALACIAAGAQDYLEKDELDPRSLRRAVGYAVSRYQEGQLRALRETTARLREMSTAGGATSITGSLAGSGNVRQRHPQVFVDLTNAYAGLLEAYLEQIIKDTTKPIAAMERLITRLGDAGGGPRDLIDVHVAAMDDALGGVHKGRQRAIVTESRLLALELMGMLVDYYRVGLRRGEDE